MRLTPIGILIIPFLASCAAPPLSVDRLQEFSPEKKEQSSLAQLTEDPLEVRAHSVLSEFVPYIQEKVKNSWLRPAGSPTGLSCMMQVTLIPGGEVVSARVIRSSGNALFDESVERAIQKASPLPLPEDTAIFKYFRVINFDFTPNR